MILARLFPIRCRVCKRKPEEIQYYRDAAGFIHDSATAEEFVRHDEPTFNRFTRRFTCVECAEKRA